MKLAVYLPALNEAGTIGQVLDGIPSAIPRITHITRIVVDDGSTDGTAAVAELHGAIVVRHPRNLGTGRAFMSGVQAGVASGADIIAGMDADGQFRPGDLSALIAPIVNGEADVVLCTRFGPGSQLAGKMPPVKRLGNWLLCRIISITVRQRFTDVSCGFRAFSRDAALRVDVRSDFEYAHESLLTWHRFGQRVVEMELPVLAERPSGKSRILSNVGSYALRSAPVLLTAIRDYSPLLFFGSLAIVAFVLSMLIGGGVFVHWWRTSETAPYTSLITVSVGGMLLAVLLGTVAMLADLIARLKFQVEELLHDSRRSRKAPGNERIDVEERETVRYE
jgi:glycosyltransferase involved in cell wall biosynthesis